jgi:hypothetical protein
LLVVLGVGILAAALLLLITHRDSHVGEQQPVDAKAGRAGQSGALIQSIAQEVADAPPIRPENSERHAQEGVAEPTGPSTTPAGQGLPESLGTPLPPDFAEATKRFESEARDPDWSDDAEAHILGEVAGITDLAAVSVDVECRASMCRLRIAQSRFSSASVNELRSKFGPFLNMVVLAVPPLVTRAPPQHIDESDLDNHGVVAYIYLDRRVT